MTTTEVLQRLSDTAVMLAYEPGPASRTKIAANIMQVLQQIDVSELDMEQKEVYDRIKISAMEILEA